MANAISHRAVVERVEPQPGEEAREAIWRAVNSFPEPKPRVLAEYARMMGFLHHAFGRLDVVANGAELRAQLGDVVKKRSQYFSRPRRERRTAYPFGG